jgi:hypothetical protein
MTQRQLAAAVRHPNRGAFLCAAGAALLGGVTAATCATADVFDWAVRAGATYSDNIARDAVGKQAETVVEGGLKLAVTEKRPWLDATLASDFQYETYLNHTFKNDVLGGANGTARVILVPGRVSWTLQDNFGQTSVDPVAVETPANRQNTNVVTTGPDLTIPFGRRMDLNVVGRYSEASYGTTLADNNQILGSVALIRHIAATSSVSLNATSQRITYAQNSINPSYKQQDAYLKLDSDRPRTTVDLRIGVTRLEELGHSTSGLLARLSLARVLSPRSKISIDGGVQFADSAASFLQTQSLGGIVLGNANAVVSTDPYRSEFGAVNWTVTSNAVSAIFRAEWDRERHRTQSILDRDSLGGRMTISRKVSPQFTMGLEGGYTRQEFREAGATVSDWSAAALLTWRLSIRLYLEGKAGRYQGDGHSTLLTPIGNGTQNYVENRASVTLSYGRIH